MANHHWKPTLSLTVVCNKQHQNERFTSEKFDREDKIFCGIYYRTDTWLFVSCLQSTFACLQTAYIAATRWIFFKFLKISDLARNLLSLWEWSHHLSPDKYSSSPELRVVFQVNWLGARVSLGTVWAKKVVQLCQTLSNVKEKSLSCGRF